MLPTRTPLQKHKSIKLPWFCSSSSSYNYHLWFNVTVLIFCLSVSRISHITTSTHLNTVTQSYLLRSWTHSMYTSTNMHVLASRVLLLLVYISNCMSLALHHKTFFERHPVSLRSCIRYARWSNIISVSQYFLYVSHVTSHTLCCGSKVSTTKKTA